MYIEVDTNYTVLLYRTDKIDMSFIRYIYLCEYISILIPHISYNYETISDIYIEVL
jgi:hypothetical protein